MGREWELRLLLLNIQITNPFFYDELRWRRVRAEQIVFAPENPPLLIDFSRSSWCQHPHHHDDDDDDGYNDEPSSWGPCLYLGCNSFEYLSLCVSFESWRMREKIVSILIRWLSTVMRIFNCPVPAEFIWICCICICMRSLS